MKLHQPKTAAVPGQSVTATATPVSTTWHRGGWSTASSGGTRLPPTDVVGVMARVERSLGVSAAAGQLPARAVRVVWRLRRVSAGVRGQR